MAGIQSPRKHTARALAAVLGLASVLASPPPVEAARLHVCTIGFNSPEELAVVRSHLPAEDFDFIDFSPPLVSQSASGDAELPSPFSAPEPQTGGRSWLVRQCRPDLQCDVVVVSGEFAGGFFGHSGVSVRLPEIEEASCRPECRGLFHTAREVFLLACNTLATKAQDTRTPEEYLRVLLDHGLDGALAERVVNLRYGPLGPSFRESFRRVFMGVPRIYGFASVAPRAEWTTPRLDQYFRAKGNYRAYLDKVGYQSTENNDLLRAFEGTSLIQMAGVTPLDPGAAAQAVICGLYDEDQTVTQRLSTIRQLLRGPDLLSYLPRIEAFFNRHPPEQFRGSEKVLYDAIRREDTARMRVIELVGKLDLSAEKMELAHLAEQLQWISKEEFRRLAIDSVRKLLAQPQWSDVVDVVCQITNYEPVGNAFGADDLPPQPLFPEPDWYRLAACVAPADPRMGQRLVRGLNSVDPAPRIWASYALSRLLPLDNATLMQLVTHLGDPSPDVQARLHWIFVTQKPLPPDVRRAVVTRVPRLAANL
jgi:hypothetical protein